ncbi:uncharacterized protein [Miscanthus floridulus]|uniref:uncharacterized protein n=1 Tax=Miscanthus floridulus TaxID=154761 RepID=UPI003458B380
MASQMDLKSTTRSCRQSRGDPSRTTTTIHRCYTSPCDSRSDLRTTSEVVFTNNSPPLLSSVLVDDSQPPLQWLALVDDSPLMLSSALVDNPPLLLSSALADHSPPLPSSALVIDSPLLPSAAFADSLHRQPSPTSFTDVPHH